MMGIAATSIPSVDTGSFRGDMLAVLRGWSGLFTGESGPLMRSIIMAIAVDQELASTFRTDVIGMRNKEMNALLARGIERGDVRADVPVELVRELGQSVLWHRLLITGDPIEDDVVTQLVDEVLTPLTAPTTRRS